MHHTAVSFVAPYRIYVPMIFTVQTASGVAQVKLYRPRQLQPRFLASPRPLVEIKHDIFGRWPDCVLRRFRSKRRHSEPN